MIGVVSCGYSRAIIELFKFGWGQIKLLARLLSSSSMRARCSAICVFKWYEVWGIVSDHATTMPVAPYSQQVKFHSTF